MSEPGDQQPEQHPEGSSKAGTWGDWPVLVIIAGVAIWLLAVLSGGRPSLLVFLIIGFGVISLMIRRGAFTPRK